MATIVIVDDSVETLELVREVLEPEGHEIVDFSSPILALEYLAKTGCDLLILDIRMPQMDGRQLLEQLHLKNNPYIPKVILLCGNPEEGKAMRPYVAQPIASILAKPFSIVGLSKVVEEALKEGGGTNISEQ